ncbi:hypothetical protein [Lactobacillus koreensis] [Lactiplantibacillus mudanjiangensis]|uniref:hypothetical protein n=1 Tax=Lactiplantibacillus mudanjiangensis TaxID=1296538 RepID=UPI0010153E39|nr:hypothetical protein [Lactiplantibacillus mudanjiangensis]VDG31128.1 hypothetical protein [Lactobacillus koreensis] [Lactiplantibacillus mudanjiangensis]
MKKSLKLIVATLAIGNLMGAVLVTTAQASSTTTPKSLRGTWYDYTGSHRYSVTKITAHTVSRYELKPNGKTTAKQIYSSGNSGRYKLRVAKLRQDYGGSVYLLNKGAASYQQLPLMWISHRTIHGKRYRILKNYTNGAFFSVYTKHKLTHSGDYQYTGTNYMHAIGK